MAEQGDPVPVLNVPLTWVGIEEHPVVFVNQMLAQLDDRAEILLTFGQASPPAFVGTPEEIQAQARRLAYVPVKPVARFSVSRTRVVDMVNVLNQLLQIQAATRQQLQQIGQGDNL